MTLISNVAECITTFCMSSTLKALIQEINENSFREELESLLMR